VVADRADSDTGFVGERLEQLGGELTQLLREDFPADGAVLDPGDADLVLLLGSHHGVVDAGREDVVAAESALVVHCLDDGLPVIAICYGAQLAAHALGGIVDRAESPEIGWYYVDSHDPALCPPGPWVQYHYDRFTVPDGARGLGESTAGPQGFAVESPDGLLRLVAWQFHPEVTPDVLQRWVDEDAAALPGVGVDAAAFVAEAVEREAFSRASAYALVDVALDAMSVLRAKV
jgi:GMP synthase-like glutamine amidotransferase